MTVITRNAYVDRHYNKAGTREFALCTAWVNFNGTGTVAIRDSLNVSSITDNGTGDYTVNFAQAMDNVNYSAAGLVNMGSGTTPIFATEKGTSQTVSGDTFYLTRTDSGVRQDGTRVMIHFFGGITL